MSMDSLDSLLMLNQIGIGVHVSTIYIFSACFAFPFTSIVRGKVHELNKKKKKIIRFERHRKQVQMERWSCFLPVFFFS